MEFPAIVTLFALLEYMFFTLRVGLGRDKYGVAAPGTSVIQNGSGCIGSRRIPSSSSSFSFRPFGSSRIS